MESQKREAQNTDLQSVSANLHPRQGHYRGIAEPGREVRKVNFGWRRWR